MAMSSPLVFLLLGFVSSLRTPQRLNITAENPSVTFESSFDNNTNGNLYEVEFQGDNIIKDKKFFLIFESENIEFSVGILDDVEGANRGVKSIMDLLSYSGNMMLIMSDTFFNEKLDFVKKSGMLRFAIFMRSKMGNKRYRIRAEVGSDVTLSAGTVYTARIDMMIPRLMIHLTYNGNNVLSLSKIRFQLTAVKHKDPFLLASDLIDEQSTYQLNTVFGKVTGGILSSMSMNLCKSAICKYSLDIQLNNIKTVNIESFLISDIEKLSINHYEEYYDRTFLDGTITKYELPYEDSMEEMDVSVTLVPVTGVSSLYINAKTLQSDIESFDWKEKGGLAKRLTVKWNELVTMRAEKSSLFIAVSSPKQGEYLLKVDAHEPGFRGRLVPGVYEQGFVQYDELTCYLYLFEVVESQEIEFQVDLNTVTGIVNLYLRPCDPKSGCIFTKDDIKKEDVMKVENEQQSKFIRNKFKCDHTPGAASTMCEYVIAVVGNENHGSHYEIALTPLKFHRLMLPGHATSLRLNPDETAYFKFSFPGRDAHILNLSVEPLWGTFEMFISRTDPFPSDQSNIKSESFTASKNGLYGSMKVIDLSGKSFGGGPQGVYFIAFHGTSASAVNIKVFEKKLDSTDVHTLVAGSQVRGEVTYSNDIIYYTFKISLDDKKAGNINLVLTPLKGNFIMFARRDGRLPTAQSKEFFSQNHRLELTRTPDSKDVEEYVVGVQLSPDQTSGGQESFQFMLSLTYASRPLRLDPGVLINQLVDTSNYYFIEVHDSMVSLLIIKSIKDGYNLSMCAVFSSNEISPDFSSCVYTANDRIMAIFISESELKENCQKSAQNGKCLVHLTVSGNKNQSFAVGYTYNDQPFHLVNNQIFQGPIVLGPEQRINFVYHPEPEKPLNIHFNSKGQKVAVYSKLGDARELESAGFLTFPTAATSDTEAVRTGHVTSIFYPVEKITKFLTGNAELLVSVRGTGAISDKKFDLGYAFSLQVSNGARELIRTEIMKVDLNEDEFHYFTLYNSGVSNSLRVYANANVATRLELIIASGLQSRPPHNSRGIAKKVGIGAVELELTPIDVKSDPHKDSAGLKDYFTLAIKSSSPCSVDLFWNNKEDLNFVELTPNHPVSMTLDKEKQFYFSIFARDPDNQKDKGSIVFYIMLNVRANIYITKSLTGDLDAPGKNNFIWKNSVGDLGGVAMIEIPITDSNYCSDCSYIGHIDTLVDGTVNIMGTVKHDNTPLLLAQGFTFPDFLAPHSKTMYRIDNPDSDIVDLSISMLSGIVNIFISDTPDVSEARYKEMHSIESELQIHKFIVIKPSNFGISTYHDFYVLISNPKLDPAAFTVSIDKNSFKSPFSPGITKFLNLAPQESTDYFYKPKPEEDLFEVRLELRQVFDKYMAPIALSKLASFIDVFHLNENNDKFMLKYKSKSISGNKIYITFNITENTQGIFTVQLYNPVPSGVALSVDLLNGNYKLVNLNEFMIDILQPEETAIYEAYSTPGKLLFVDVRNCAGDVSVAFYQDDYENVANKNYLEYKTIKDTNSFMNYLKVNSTRIFLKVTNNKPTPAIYEMTILNERDLDVNPYSEITQGDGGKVSIETDNELLRFQPINIKSTYSNQFSHRITYFAYLSDDFSVMRYGRNCGNFMIEHSFKDPELRVYSTSFEFSDIEASMKNKTSITLSVPGLRSGVKYYGVLVAKIELFPLENGYVSPSRSAKAYYDEFVVVTSKYSIPFNLIISVVISLGLMLCLFCIVKSYIFGNINKMRGMEKLSDLSEFDDNVLGFNIINILEKEYEEDEHAEAAAESGKEAHAETNPESPGPKEGEPKIEIEMIDKSDATKPLDS